RVADILALSLSTPRLALTQEAAAGLSGRAFLSVAGPPGALEVEPWLFVSRLPWLFRAQGWESALLHNGLATWAEAKARIDEATRNRRPVLWIWVGGDGGVTWGNGTHVLPEGDGCFAAVVGEKAVEPLPPEAVVSWGILEALSSAHAATCSGLSGLESLDDPYVAQGFGAYKRLYVDLSVNAEGSAVELSAIVDSWAQRRRLASGFLRWAAEILPEHSSGLSQAAACFEQEAIQSLDPLARALAEDAAALGSAKELLWRGLSWYIKGIQMMEPAAFTYAGLDSSLWGLLHAPDEEPMPQGSVAGVLELIRHQMPAVRRIAYRKLIGAPLHPENYCDLEDGLRDEDPMVQQAALAALEAIRPPDLRGILWRAFQDASSEVLHGNGYFHRALVLALTRVREAEVPGLLAEAAAHCPPGDCRPRSLPAWCAEGIVDLFGQASWPYLRVMLQASCPYAREAAAVALGRLGRDEAHSELHAIAFRDTSAFVQCAALGALGRTGFHEAIPRLLDLLEAPEMEIKTAAASALVEMGEPVLPFIEGRMKRVGPDGSRTLAMVRDAVRRGEARNLLKR
ncbi:HEAT repeat domain-containing protein, partial [Candidatus Fermentibacteria bacterium]|nr:HEAT repeat domain-containing protein [Candidatus Fermentibacteria bacterium]